MSVRDAFTEAFGVWPEALLYLDLIVEEREMELVVAMAATKERRALTVEEIAALLGTTPDEASAFVRRCYGRGILNKSVEDGVVRYAPADFYARLDYVIKFENWDAIPPAGRQTLDRRYLQEFIEKKRSQVEAIKRGEGDATALHNDAVLLLGEVEEMIAAATDIIVQPCDCRRAGQNCDRPTDVCIGFDQVAQAALDRGHGRRLTNAEAIELARWADKRGLMHTGDADWRVRGLTSLCNCCACDCYPFRAARELDSKGHWPKERYVAVFDRERCTLCGACVKRCHFGAFYHDDTMAEHAGKARRNVAFAPDQCWGCGLCANACPADAIQMERLDERQAVTQAPAA